MRKRKETHEPAFFSSLAIKKNNNSYRLHSLFCIIPNVTFFFFFYECAATILFVPSFAVFIRKLRKSFLTVYSSTPPLRRTSTSAKIIQHANRRLYFSHKLRVSHRHERCIFSRSLVTIILG